jgi:hypothetical protein
MDPVLTESLLVDTLEKNGIDKETIQFIQTQYQRGELDPEIYNDLIKPVTSNTNVTDEESRKLIKELYSYYNFSDKEFEDTYKSLMKSDYKKLLHKLKDPETMKKAKLEIEEKDKTKHLWDEHYNDDAVSTMFDSHTAMFLPLEICGKKVECLVDTGAQINIISEKLVKELKLESLVDKSYKTTVKGVGEQKTCGVIPYIIVKLNDSKLGAIEVPMYFIVMNSQVETDIIIGLPFMRTHQVILDYAKCTMKLAGREVHFKIY